MSLLWHGGGALDAPELDLETLTTKLPHGEMERIDRIWKKRNFPNRSEFVRYIIRRELDDFEKKMGRLA